MADFELYQRTSTTALAKKLFMFWDNNQISVPTRSLYQDAIALSVL
jgi:hypothetical protein